MVNKERVQLLVDELMTTDKEQGNGYLNREGKFCCLGIACEVAIANGLNVNVYVSHLSSGDPVTIYDDRRGQLPQSVMDWYGFDYADPLVAVSAVPEASYLPCKCERCEKLGVGIAASVANDVREWDFKQIAKGFADYYLKD